MELCINKREFNELTNGELGDVNGGAEKVVEYVGVKFLETAVKGIDYILKNSKPLAPNQNPYFNKKYSRSSNKYPRLN